jgi:hypothetical protein
MNMEEIVKIRKKTSLAAEETSASVVYPSKRSMEVVSILLSCFETATESFSKGIDGAVYGVEALVHTFSSYLFSFGLSTRACIILSLQSRIFTLSYLWSCLCFM